MSEQGQSDAAREGPKDLTPTQASLFDDRVQAWIHPDFTRPPEIERERQALLASLGNSDLGNVELKVAYVLQRFPETRDSHTRLALRYWYEFEGHVLDDWDRKHLDVLLDLEKFENIERMARNVQNSLMLWPSSKRFREFRNIRQLQFNRYFAEQRQGDPEIRFYLDETGTHMQSRFLGVAGICVADWRQYESHHAALSQWRRSLGFPGTLHATDVTEDSAKELELLNQLNKRKGGLLFVGHTMSSKGTTDRQLMTLFVQLVLDSLQHLEANGCLQEPKALRIIKERNDNFDSVYRAPMVEELDAALAAEFLNRVYLREILPIPNPHYS